MPWSCVGFYVVVMARFHYESYRCKDGLFCCGRRFSTDLVQSCTGPLVTRSGVRVCAGAPHKNLQTFGPKLSVSGRRCFQVAAVSLENWKYLDLLLELKQGQRRREVPGQQDPSLIVQTSAVSIPVHEHPDLRAAGPMSIPVRTGHVDLHGMSREDTGAG